MNPNWSPIPAESPPVRTPFFRVAAGLPVSDWFIPMWNLKYECLLVSKLSTLVQSIIHTSCWNHKTNLAI